MNRWMALSAALLLLTCYVHVFAGGPEIHLPIQASELSLELRAISAVLWHAVTVILLTFAAAAIWVALRPNRDLVMLLIAVQIGFAGLFLYYGQMLLGTVWPMPQWIIFLTIPAIMGIGLKRGAA